MLCPFPPTNTEIIQGQAGDILRSWQETTPHLCQDGMGCGTCEEGECWGGRLLSPAASQLLQQSSAKQHPAKPGWTTGWVLPSLGCSEHPSPPPLAAAPQFAEEMERNWPEGSKTAPGSPGQQESTASGSDFTAASSPAATIQELIEPGWQDAGTSSI